jgi:hypothetical protein
MDGAVSPKLFYYRSEWLIRRLKRDGFATGGVLLTVADIAHNAGCFLGMETERKWKSGYYVIYFKWSAASEPVFQDCYQAISEYMQFTNLETITREEFEATESEHLVISIMSVEFVLYLEELAEHNEATLSNC